MTAPKKAFGTGGVLSSLARLWRCFAWQSALAIVAVSFSGRERDTAIGAWIATCWGAQAVGPLVGGLLIATLSWQWIFWMNLPIGAVALVLMWKTTAE